MKDQTWKWVNTTEVTSKNLLEKEHKISVAVVDDLTEKQRDKLVLNTIKRQVQQKLRVELDKSKDPEYLHTEYPEDTLLEYSASELQSKERDPKAALKREILKHKAKGLSAEEIIALFDN